MPMVLGSDEKERPEYVEIPRREFGVSRSGVIVGFTIQSAIMARINSGK